MEFRLTRCSEAIFPPLNSVTPHFGLRDRATWWSHLYALDTVLLRSKSPSEVCSGFFSRAWENVRMLSFVKRGLPSRRLTSGSSTTCQLSHLSSAMRSSLSANRGVDGGRLRLAVKIRNLCGPSSALQPAAVVISMANLTTTVPLISWSMPLPNLAARRAFQCYGSTPITTVILDLISQSGWWKRFAPQAATLNIICYPILERTAIF